MWKMETFIALLVISSTSSFAISPSRYSPPYGGAIRRRSKDVAEQLKEQLGSNAVPITNNDMALFGSNSTTNAQTWNDPASSNLPAVVLASVEPTCIPSAEPLISQYMFLSAMSFLSASGDVISHKRHGGYANMMTGNIIRMASALSESRWNDSVKAITLLSCYMFGTVVFRNVLKHHDGRRMNLWWSSSSQQRNKATRMTKSPLLVAPLSLAILVMGELCNSMPILSLAGGFINAATVHASGGTVVFALTGHLSKVLNGMLDYGRTRLWNQALNASVIVVSCFFGGAALTTILWNLTGSKPFFIMIGLLYAGILGLVGLPKPVAFEEETWSHARGGNSTLASVIS